MTDTNTSGADVLASFNAMIDLAKAHLCRADIADAAKETFRTKIQDAEKAWHAVAALIERNAELEAERDDATKARDIARSMVRDLFRERDALAAEVKALRLEVESSRDVLREFQDGRRISNPHTRQVARDIEQQAVARALERIVAEYTERPAIADQYADAINEAAAAIRKGMRLSTTAEQRDMWLAMLERHVCIETMEERRNG